MLSDPIITAPPVVYPVPGCKMLQDELDIVAANPEPPYVDAGIEAVPLPLPPRDIKSTYPFSQ
jgi:hypothetical protein